MPVLSVRSLSKSFVEQKLFEDVTFEIEKGDKVGFIGANGAGKTTLFKIINGGLSPDSGQVFISGDAAVGYMEQHACSTPGRTVYEELISVFDYLIKMEKEIELQNNIVASSPSPSAEDIERQTFLIEEYERLGGLTYKSRACSALSGFGFDEGCFNMPTGKLSGGQRSKLSLLKLLLSKSNFLLLDEPTNHLDLKAVSWLESFIREFKGSMLIISHDRYFLDSVTTKTIELEHNRAMMYKGGYSEFMRKKQAYEESLRNKYENDLKQIRRIESIVEQQKRWGRERNFITAASKQKQADRIRAQLVSPEGSLETLHMSFSPKRTSGNDVLMCSGLSKSFDGRPLFCNADLHIRRGERVFIIGENGCGKTTLFNMLLGKIPCDAGIVEFGAQVDVGYFDQMQNNLDLNKTALDEVWDAFPNMTQTQVRTALGSFLFKGDQVFKPLSKMSGGERARVSLLKLILNGSNFLLLDEPTNHLDSSSREQLENTLADYEGTMLIISHDRYFINKLATRILDLTAEGMVEYLGNYDYYLEKTGGDSASVSGGGPAQKPKKAPNDYQLRKQQQARQRKRQKDLNKTEAKIEELDREISLLNNQLQQQEIASDYEKLLQITGELEQKQAQQDELYLLWEELSNAEAQ